jgi:hypothetical protein
MFATVRTLRTRAGNMDQVLRILHEEFVPQLSERPGFCAYHAIDAGEGSLVTVSVVRSRKEAERSTQIAADFVRERLRDFEIERVDVKSGAVIVSAAVPALLEHA